MPAGAEAIQHQDIPIIFSGADRRHSLVNVRYRYGTDAFIEISVRGII
jgi:hypothetical protein